MGATEKNSNGAASSTNAWRDPEKTRRILDAGQDMGRFVAGGTLIAFLLAVLAMIEVFAK